MNTFSVSKTRVEFPNSNEHQLQKLTYLYIGWTFQLNYSAWSLIQKLFNLSFSSTYTGYLAAKIQFSIKRDFSLKCTKVKKICCNNFGITDKKIQKYPSRGSIPQTCLHICNVYCKVEQGEKERKKRGEWYKVDAGKSGWSGERRRRKKRGTKEPRHTFQESPHANESDSIQSVSQFIPTRVSKACAEEVRDRSSRGACARDYIMHLRTGWYR